MAILFVTDLGVEEFPPSGGGATVLDGDVTGPSDGNTVSLLQGQTLTITGPLAAGQVLAPDAGGTAIVNADIATVLGYDPAANLGALGIPDPDGAPDGQVVTTAGGVYVLAAPASGIDTSLQAAPDTGWTAAGDGTASITAGVATLTVTAAQNTALLAIANPISSPLLPAIEVSARVTRTTTPGGSPLQRLGIGIGNALRTDVPATARGLLAEVDPAATASFIANSAGSWTSLGTAALPATVDSGNLWLRLVYSAGGVSAFVGSGATRPSAWTLIAAAAPQHAISGVGAATHVQVYAYRNAGTGDMVVRVDQIQWRSLLGAPT